MKKFLLFFALLVIGSIVLNSCSKDKATQDTTCSDLSNKVDLASLTYTQYPTAANCQAYKTSINNFIKCPYLAPSQKAQLELLLPLLICKKPKHFGINHAAVFGCFIYLK